SGVLFRASIASSNLPARTLSTAGLTVAALDAAAALRRSRKNPTTCGASTDDLSKASIFEVNAIGAAARIGTVPAPGDAIVAAGRVTRNGRATWPTFFPPTITTARAT